MSALRRIPTFIRLGLGWWLVLVAWPLSRPFALYGLNSVSHKPPMERAALIAWSVGHALVTAWLLIKVLRRWNRQPSPLGAYWWGLLLGILAVQSWWLAWTLRGVLEGGYRGLSFVDALEKLSFGLFVLPFVGMAGTVGITWPLWVLGWLTAWFFPRLDAPRSPVPG